MKNTNTNEVLAGILRDRLAAGLAIAPEVIFFAESTYGLTADELMAALTDESFEDQETLLKLIIHPDRKLRLAVEPILLEAELTEENIAEIIDLVSQGISRLTLHVDAPVGVCDIDLTKELLHHYVAKLYLDQGYDKLGENLRETLPERTALEASVMLRCHHDPLSGEVQSFLADFIDRFGTRERPFLPLFEFLLPLLSTMPEQTDIGEFLLDQHEAHLQTLAEILRFERKKEQYGMEYLMMQRYRVPPESREVVLERLAVLNSIVFDILGLTPRQKPQLLQRDLGTFKPGDDMEKLIALLS